MSDAPTVRAVQAHLVAAGAVPVVDPLEDPTGWDPETYAAAVRWRDQQTSEEGTR